MEQGFVTLRDAAGEPGGITAASDRLVVDISILGPMAVSVGGVSVVPTAPKARSLLALLALQPGRVVTISRIRDELWGDHPPRSASTTLQTYVMQLRNAFDAAAPHIKGAGKLLLQTCGNGYLLTVGGGRSDLDEFEGRVSASGRRIEVGDLWNASRLVRESLEMWRGSPFIDVQRGRVLDAEAVRLQQRRRSVRERGIQIDLAMGRHHDVIDDLSALALEDRTDEGIHAHLMLALHRCGRRAHALRVFGRLRTAMLDELGLEPSAGVQQLQRAILAADSGLDDGSQVTKVVAGLAMFPNFLAGQRRPTSPNIRPEERPASGGSGGPVQPTDPPRSAGSRTLGGHRRVRPCPDRVAARIAARH